MYLFGVSGSTHHRLAWIYSWGTPRELCYLNSLSTPPVNRDRMHCKMVLLFPSHSSLNFKTIKHLIGLQSNLNLLAITCSNSQLWANIYRCIENIKDQKWRFKQVTIFFLSKHTIIVKTANLSLSACTNIKGQYITTQSDIPEKIISYW